jgi:mRNA interferase RelE/StbE
MGSFRIEWKHSAEREVRKIDPVQIPAIVQGVDSLTRDPFPAGCRKLHGTEHEYRIRVGDYRVIYQVDAENEVVTIYHVRHRRDAYRS